MLELTRLQARYGFQLVMLGDPKQSQAVDAPAIGLLTKALGPEPSRDRQLRQAETGARS